MANWSDHDWLTEQMYRAVLAEFVFTPRTDEERRDAMGMEWFWRRLHEDTQKMAARILPMQKIVEESVIGPAVRMLERRIAEALWPARDAAAAEEDG